MYTCITNIIPYFGTLYLKYNNFNIYYCTKDIASIRKKKAKYKYKNT